jgi:hypothetical protein
MPILAASTVTQDAIELVESRPMKGFAAIAMPAIVELSTGKTHQYEGKLILGAVYTRWIRERITKAMPVS